MECVCIDVVITMAEDCLQSPRAVLILLKSDDAHPVCCALLCTAPLTDNMALYTTVCLAFAVGMGPWRGADAAPPIPTTFGQAMHHHHLDANVTGERFASQLSLSVVMLC